MPGCSVALPVSGAAKAVLKEQRRRRSTGETGESSRAFLSKGGSQSAIKQIRKEIPAERFCTKKETEGTRRSKKKKTSLVPFYFH
jgi:hypothetical protein